MLNMSRICACSGATEADMPAVSTPLLTIPSRAAVSCVALALALFSAPAAAQVTSRVVVTQTQTQALAPGLSRHHVTRNVTTTTVRQTLVVREPALDFTGAVPFGLLPVMAGIRATPVAPPSVYRIAGSRTAMHDADELRMRQINPGARVISPDDLTLTRETRRRYAVAEHAQRHLRHNQSQAGVGSRPDHRPRGYRPKEYSSGEYSSRDYRPRVIVIFPQ